LKAIRRSDMHRTIEALYKDGKIIPMGDFIPVREARVLVTFIEDDKVKAPAKKKGLKFKTYRCGGMLRDFTREDAYDIRI
jgi:hypothetical protein